MSRVLAFLVALLQLAGSPSPSGAVQNGAGAGSGIGAGGGPGQPARDAARPQTGTASIRGRVTVSDTGAPLRRASIRVNFNSPGVPGGGVTTTTDDDGRFAVGGLPAGRYTIYATKGGYVGKTSDPFNLADNEHRDSFNLTVARGAVIAGTITDEFGDPVVGAQVMPMRSQFVGGTRRLTPFGATATTNDIGEYRIFGLDAGQYYVAVTSRPAVLATPVGPAVLATSAGPAGPSPAGGMSGYAPTYYPGTPDPSGATRLAIATAQTLNGIDVSLTPIKLAAISGVAYDSEGRPFTRGSVMATPDGWASGIGTTNAQVRPDGTFTLAGLPPGRYILRANAPPPMPPPPPTPGAPTLAARGEFSIGTATVTGDDLSGIVLVTPRPVTISGRVVFDDQAAAMSIKPSAIRISATPVNPLAPQFGVPGGPPPAVNDDFTFQVTTSPGLVALRAAVPDQGRTAWHLKAVRVRGSDVIDSGAEFKDGESVDDVEIEMTARGQTVSGTITAGQGAPAGRVSVLLFSQNADDWSRPINRYWAAARTDENGQFKVASLPVGDYYAFVVGPNTTSAEWSDPDFLVIAARSATRFSLHEGDNLALDLTTPR